MDHEWELRDQGHPEGFEGWGVIQNQIESRRLIRGSKVDIGMLSVSGPEKYGS